MSSVGARSILLFLFLSSTAVRNSVCLIKNCVTPAEWDSDTSNAPRCEVVSHAAEVTCYGEGQVSIERLSPERQKQGEYPTIVCNASYLLDVDVAGFKMKGQPRFFFFRHVEAQPRNSSRINNAPPKYIYSVVFALFVGVWSPRDITFRGLEFPERKTNFYVYYPGPNDRALPFDWPNEKNIPTIIEPEGQWAILPCLVTHYTDKITLTKVGPEGGDIIQIIDNTTVRFEPRLGFILDTYTIPTPWGVYTCHAMNPRKSKTDLESLQVRLRKPNDFTVVPSLPRLDLFDGADLSLSCYSNQPIEMHGSMDGIPIPAGNFSYYQNTTYRLEYRVDYIYTDVLKFQTGSITCNNQIGRSHTWEVSVWDLEDNRLLQMRNNGSLMSCKSEVSQYVTLFNAECNNPTHCRSRKQAIDTFGAGQCDLALKFVECGPYCDEKTKRGGKCLTSKRSKQSGVFRCETDTLTHSLSYLIGYDGKIYTNPKLREIPSKALVRIIVPNETLYTTVPNTFKCSASSFASSGDYKWLLRLKNGTTYLPNIVATRTKHNFAKNEDSIWEADMIFNDAKTEIEVICYVPIWNSKEDWLSVSVLVNVSVPEKPEIDASDKSIRYFIGDKNRNLPCTASGKPVPKVQWYRNGKVVNDTDTDEDGQILVFPSITKNLEGIYTCVATNFAGNDTDDFSITVDTPPNVTLYIVIGVVLLVLLTITLVVLYWKLLKAKDEIRHLSDEEVNEFLNGNPEAAKAAKEPHEIIMYLPFNPEFEIERDRLMFDENDILGSGAFGMVLRGKLTGHHEEVAIKTLKPYSAISYFKALLSELKIMVYIGKHDNVVTLIGAYTGKIKERILYMVVELSPFGNLEDYLRNNQKNFQNQIRNDKICVSKSAFSQLYTNCIQNAAENPMYINTLYTTDLVSMAYQIAEGMHHLSSKKVIHADLAARNVLLYKDGVVKITDFGLSRQLYAYTSYMKKEQEPLPWRSMAIESLREMNFSTQSDVWAYGVTLWEVFSLGAVPYPGLSWSIDFVDKLVHGLRLSKPHFATTEIYEVLIQCWHSEPDQRLSFDELRNIFLNMKTSVEKLCEN